MAVTSIWKVCSRMDHVVDYITNSEKTNGLETVIGYDTNDNKTINKQYVSCINCLQSNPYTSMLNTKKQFKDEKEILGFHGYQSFAEGEVTADLAHQIGVELAQKLWGDKFEVVVSTHLNTANIHNHFLVNATSFVNGKRYCNTKKDYSNMKRESDVLCKRYGLSIINQKNKIVKVTMVKNPL